MSTHDIHNSQLQLYYSIGVGGGIARSRECLTSNLLNGWLKVHSGHNSANNNHATQSPLCFNCKSIWTSHDHSLRAGWSFDCNHSQVYRTLLATSLYTNNNLDSDRWVNHQRTGNLRDYNLLVLRTVMQLGRYQRPSGRTVILRFTIISVLVPCNISLMRISSIVRNGGRRAPS